MHNVLLIIQREFLERVRTRSFVVGTALFPVIVFALTLLPTLVESEGRERTIVLVDEAPAGVGERFTALLATPREDRGNTYVVERTAGPFDAVRPELIRRAQEEEIDGFVHLPPDVVERGAISYRARNIANVDVLRDLRVAAGAAVQGERLQRSGIEPSAVMEVMRPVDVGTVRITDRGEESGDAQSAFFLAYTVMFLVYILTIQYGANVMRSVLEEKTSRIAEVIVGSVRPMHLMLGKILGVGAVALLQVGIWLALVAVAAWQSETLARRLGIPPDALESIRVPPSVGLAFVGFFLLGFFLYAALFAALGAAVTSEQEAQQLTIVVLLPLFVPLVFVVRVATDPLGSLATALGWIPFTAPMVMPMRMASTGLPAVQLWGSLAGLALAVVLVAWLAGKIYRVGILSTGKRPTLRELGRWLRTA